MSTSTATIHGQRQTKDRPFHKLHIITQWWKRVMLRFILPIDCCVNSLSPLQRCCQSHSPHCTCFICIIQFKIVLVQSVTLLLLPSVLLAPLRWFIFTNRSNYCVVYVTLRPAQVPWTLMSAVDNWCIRTSDTTYATTYCRHVSPSLRRLLWSLGDAGDAASSRVSTSPIIISYFSTPSETDSIPDSRTGGALAVIVPSSRGSWESIRSPWPCQDAEVEGN